jgi:hypothetical protein
MLPAPDGVLAGADLGQAAAEVDGAAEGYCRIAPGNRLAERIVNLEGARAVAVTFQQAAIAGR